MVAVIMSILTTSPPRAVGDHLRCGTSAMIDLEGVVGGVELVDSDTYDPDALDTGHHGLGDGTTGWDVRALEEGKMTSVASMGPADRASGSSDDVSEPSDVLLHEHDCFRALEV